MKLVRRVVETFREGGAFPGEKFSELPNSSVRGCSNAVREAV